MYVLDSSALIEIIKEFPLSTKIMSSLKGENLVTTSICAHEVMAGANTEKDEFVLRKIFNSCEVLNHDIESSIIGAKIYKDLRKRGKIMGQMDILIAAVCKSHNATLVTLDKKFKNLKDVKVKIIS